MPLKAIIFDVDGTLAETEEAHRNAYNQTFAEAGRPWHWSEADYKALLTTPGGRERLARFMTEIGMVPDPGVIAALHVRKNALYAKLVSGGAVGPRPGVVRLIDEARRSGMTLAIATTTSLANLTALLRHGFAPDAASWFAAIGTSEDVVAKKPDPEVYRHVRTRLSLDPTECVAIEDSLAGLTAARACGIPTVVTPSRYTGWESFPGAVLVTDTLETVDLARLRSLVP